ncbi:type I secretion system permease/ATPase [Loktanella sp. SALINAS62]|uniref:type I secretion system permease/ATPase n=1 Tax=Loktanella sp. SALINAS62 TaxID=2706124 RepID=UPI001B8AB350|nr:type I secretion system permease/ATPase [Loktanella sp. SALINAS62]MBS1302134.1 type I secretion system permease/ATPase [Loktanella sp. SALINAS62]
MPYPANTSRQGAAELALARREGRALYRVVLVFSLFVNLLMLTAPFYMLNVYDRVLGSRSLETLVALSVLATFLFGIMGVLDHARGLIMARVAARFQMRLDRRVFMATLRAQAQSRGGPTAHFGPHDLDKVQRGLTSPGFAALFDLPWVPLFLLGIFIFHPGLALLALGGGAVLVGAAFANHVVIRGPLDRLHDATRIADRLHHQTRASRDTIVALGMQEASVNRWQTARAAALDATMATVDIRTGFTTFIKTFRLFIQTAMLGLGAFLVLRGVLTPGAMIAASVLMGRALAPVEQIVSQWALLSQAREGWRNLTVLLANTPLPATRTTLPKPLGRICVDQITVVPPGQRQAAVRMISFDLAPGQALGVIGPSGAGKSALAYALTGIWAPAGGVIRLDGATLDQYDPDFLGQHIGYLPQRVQLSDGTIRDNIARMSVKPDDAAVIAAARAAGAHDMILSLPDGYDTDVTAQDGGLSGGQIQRIGLARALYGDPVMLVFDEPDSNLDNAGSVALTNAIRMAKADGKSIVIMAHRPAAIQDCDLLLMLENGTRRAFGSPDDVLRDVVHRPGAHPIDSPRVAGRS